MPTIMKVAEPHSETITEKIRNNQQPVAENKHPSVPAAHRYVPPPSLICTYHSTSPKGKPVPAPITQDKEEPTEVTKLATKNLRRSPRITSYVNPCTAGIAMAALHQFIGNELPHDIKRIVKGNDTTLGPEEVANGVVHPVIKEKITKYKKLIDDPLMRLVWSKAMCKEIGRICQGLKIQKEPTL